LVESWIRPETPADVDAVFALTAAAFGRAEEARLVDAIRASDRYVGELSLVAVDGGKVVGHVMLSYADLDGRDVLQLSPLSVAPDRQGEGIGSALSRKALRLANERGEPLVVVLGHPTYYPRFGFRPASSLGIEPPDPSMPDEAFMVIPLGAYDRALRGKVTFPPAFG
jgi:putative acetyltransferase